MRRSWVLCALLVAAVQTAGSADDAANGYARIRPSLVKVWAFDRNGRPLASGSGIVIVSNAARSLVLTAAHVIDGAATIKIDIDRDRHDIAARVNQRSPRDLAVLAADRGNLVAATFAARSHAVVEGNVIAVAGFVEHDELIGAVGQEPRLLYPGTISSRPDDGAYLELENVHIEEGLSGGPVFDPRSGDVLGIVTSRTSDRRGGFADAAALVVLPFLAANAIGFRERVPAAAQIAKAPESAPSAPSSPKPQPAPAARSAPAARPSPVPERSPETVALASRHWQTADPSPRRLEYVRGDCTIALSVAVTRLAFELPASDGGPEAPAPAKLTLRIGRRVPPNAACSDVDATEPVDVRYEMTASSYDGRHVTLRFRTVPEANQTAADDALFPADVSVDADLRATPVTAHVQLIDTDWDGTLDVIAADR